MLIANQLTHEEMAQLLEMFWPLKREPEYEGTDEQLLEDLTNEIHDD